LQWQGLEQGIAARGATRACLGNVLLSGIDVVKDVFKERLSDFAAAEIVRRFDAQVSAGVYALELDTLPRLKGSKDPLPGVPNATGKPPLVLVHGTFSNVSGTYAKLWTQH